MNLFKKLPALGLALLFTGVVTVTAFAASADTAKVTDDKGNPITPDTISVTADEENPVTVDSINATDDQGNPIKVDSISITDDGKNSITMKSLGYTDSDLEGNGTITVNKEAWAQK